MGQEQNYFDGASTAYRLELKGLRTATSDKAAAMEVKRLRLRSHHLCRNNPMAITARNRLVAHWTGTGIKVKWDNARVQKAWDLFAKSPCLDGWGTFAGVQNLWGSGLFESGEIPTRMVIRDVGKDQVPLKLQIFEAEQLDINYSPNPSTRYGMTFDEDGKPVTFHFWKRHPSDLFFGDTTLRIPVEARDVCHIFQRDRPGQWRGIPKLTPLILPLYEMDELMDATLVRQKLAQACGWIITKSEEGAAPFMGSVTESATDSDPSSTEEPYLDTRIQKIRPGGIHYLERDEKFEFASIQDIGANLSIFLEHSERLCAGAIDLTYEQLTGDLSKVNFSSSRAGTMEFRKRVALVQRLNFVDQGLAKVTDRFKELGAIALGSEFADATCKYIMPKLDWVDPLKDIQADLLEVRSGFSTLEAKLAEREVEDFSEHMVQLMKEQGMNVILDTNPKHNTQGVKTVKTGNPKARQGKTSTPQAPAA